MSLIVSEVYDALLEAGASEEKAKAAAAAIPLREQLASKDDIDRLHGVFTSDIARLEQRLVALESEVRVLKFAVFTFGPLILALLVRLVFFP